MSNRFLGAAPAAAAAAILVLQGLTRGRKMSG